MSDNMGCAVIALSVAIATVAVASCVALGNNAHHESQSKMTAEQLCVQRAMTQHDRMQCMGAKP